LKCSWPFGVKWELLGLNWRMFFHWKRKRAEKMVGSLSTSSAALTSWDK
jgi:hypothetical protein